MGTESGAGTEGRERGSWVEWEKGGKAGGTRAEDGAGGGAGRILEVCAGGKGLSPRSGGLLELGGLGTQKVAGMAAGGSKGAWGGADRNVRHVSGDIYFKSW